MEGFAHVLHFAFTAVFGQCVGVSLRPKRGGGRGRRRDVCVRVCVVPELRDVAPLDPENNGSDFSNKTLRAGRYLNQEQGYVIWSHFLLNDEKLRTGVTRSFRRTNFRHIKQLCRQRQLCNGLGANYCENDFFCGTYCTGRHARGISRRT